MPLEPFNTPFARQAEVPGGLPGSILFGYAMNRAVEAGIAESPIYVGRSNAFSAMRGLNYDARQMSALESAVQQQREALQTFAGGVAAVGGREVSPEMQQAVGRILDAGAPLAMTMTAQSASFRQALSAISNGASSMVISAGMEGITRRSLDPVTGGVGMGVESSNAIASAVRGMLLSGPTYGTAADGGQGAMLSRGAAYGFTDIDTMHAMASMYRDGALPSAGAPLATLGDSRLRAALQSGDLSRDDYALGRNLTAQERGLIDQGLAQRSDFYDPARVATLNTMDEFGITDQESFNKFEAALNDPNSAQSVRLQEINASRFAKAAQQRLQALQAVTEFLTDDEIQALGTDLADVSSAMLKQLTGNAVHQLGAGQMNRNLREVKFAADRLGLSREQVQAMAGVSAAAAAQYGFQAADTQAFMADQLAAMMQYTDMGMGNLAAAGVDMYGADSREEMAARSARGMAGVRRSRNAKMTAALSILSRNAGADLAEGGFAAKFLQEAQTGQFSEEMQQALRGTTEDLVNRIVGSSGLTREQVLGVLNQEFVLDAEMASNPELVAANRQVASADVFRTNVARSITRQLGSELVGVGGTAGEKDRLAVSLGAALAEDLRNATPEDIRDTDATGSYVSSQLGLARDAIAAQAAQGNTAAQQIMAMDPDTRDNTIRNMIASGYRAVRQDMKTSVADIVGQHGAQGSDARTNAAAYQEVMAELSSFAGGDRKAGIAKAIDLVTKAASQDISLAELASATSGVDFVGETKDDLLSVRALAESQMNTLNDQIQALPEGSARKSLQAKFNQLNRVVGKIDEFITDEGKPRSIPTDEVESALQDVEALLLRSQTMPTSVDGAGALRELQDAIGSEAAGNPVSRGAATGAQIGIGAAQRIMGGAATTETKIESATIDSVSMGPVTITLGDTVVEAGSATVASNRGSRTSIATT